MKFLKLLVLASSFGCMAQDSLAEKKVKVDFSGYIETFYAYDFEEPEQRNNYTFLYNHNRHNDFNVNMALLKAAINYENVYAKIAIHGGTYVTDNYASEDIKFLNEAYVGLFLDKKQQTSIEAGIMPSNIGFETANSHANLTVTRSILAENSPYYLTGFKLNHQVNEKLSFAFLVTNGWQRIKKINGKIAPSIGTQLTYKTNSKSVFNWSTFLGKETLGSDFTTRFFNNLYYDFAYNDRWRNILGFDLGLQKSIDSNAWHSWCSPVFITQFKCNPKWNLAYRMEYYDDAKNILIAINDVPFKTIGNSFNIDFLPNSRAKVRAEAKWFHATENIFDQGKSKENFSITSTLSFEF